MNNLFARLAIATALVGAVPAQAALTYSMQSITALSPSSGNAFEVDLTNTGPDQVIAAFSFGLSMTDTNFTFTSATTGSLVNTYIFAGGNSFDDLLNSGVVSSTATVDSLIGSDLWFGNGPGFTLGSGVTVALGEVFIDVASGAAPGPYIVSFVPGDDSLADGNGDPLSLDDTATGTITIPGTAIPEPSTVALLGLTVLPLLWARKQKAANRPA
jgi:hypothetical protein